jgi:hypothetical protein
VSAGPPHIPTQASARIPAEPLSLADHTKRTYDKWFSHWLAGLADSADFLDFVDSVDFVGFLV